MGRPWTEKEVRIVEELYGVFNYQKIAEIIDRTKSSIANQARKMGLTPKGHGSNPLSFKRKHYIDDDFFSKIDNTSAYIAGFIAADGCVMGNKIRIGLQKGDTKYLEKLKSHFQFSGPIYRYSNSSSLEMTSEKIVRDLREKFNIIERKSLVLEPPIGLREQNHILSYIKGYIDGDGSIFFTTNRGKYKYFTISVIGTEKICSYIKLEFDNILNSETPKIRKEGNIFRFRVNGKKAETVYKFLKNEVSTPTLERKWKIEL